MILPFVGLCGASIWPVGFRRLPVPAGQVDDSPKEEQFFRNLYNWFFFLVKSCFLWFPHFASRLFMLRYGLNGGLGIGGAEQGASHATPVRAFRPVDTGRFQAGQESRLDNDLCRVIGFTLSKGQ